MIKSKSSYKSLSIDKETSSQNLGKELIQTVKDTLGNSSKSLPINEFLENKNKEKEEINEFIDNKLLQKIGKTNKNILNAKDIFGVIKKIYSLELLDIYLLIIDNDILIYEQDTNNIINYIDINDGFEYNEINKITYYYNRKET